MKLPNNEIGISDILAWRECPARFVFGMKRHDEAGESPESWSPANAYGSAIHEAIHLLDDGSTEQEAVQAAFAQFSQWLGPDDVQMLYDDLETYLQRDQHRVRTLVSERDYRFPLFEHPTAGQIYFRFRLDRLYQSLDDPNLLIHVDYKSSKWVKSKEDVHKDLQLWAYNVGIHEFIEDVYPEIETPRVEQVYEQLRFGQEFTRKNDAQRQRMRTWLIAAITALIDDDELAPKFNEFCPWCPIKMDCPVVQHELTDWARARIAALMPREPKLKKDGTPSKVLGPPMLDPTRMAEYVELLPDVKRAEQVLKAFRDSVGEVLKDLPEDRRNEYRSREAPNGYTTDHRDRKQFGPIGIRLAAEEMGEDFWAAASLSAKAVRDIYGDDKEKIEEILRHQVEGSGFDVVIPRA